MYSTTSPAAEQVRQSIRMLDLDKDNDGAFDASDLFPLEGNYIFDSDNDGVGDAGDVIAAEGACLQGAPGTCPDDNALLYVRWVIFIAVIGVAVASVSAFWIKQHDLQHHVDKFLNFDAAAMEREIEREQSLIMPKRLRVIRRSGPSCKR